MAIAYFFCCASAAAAEQATPTFGGALFVFAELNSIAGSKERERQRTARDTEEEKFLTVGATTKAVVPDYHREVVTLVGFFCCSTEYALCIVLSLLTFLFGCWRKK